MIRLAPETKICVATAVPYRYAFWERSKLDPKVQSLEHKLEGEA